MLADELQLAGWMISRSGVSKIQSGLTHVSDFQLFYFGHVFAVELVALFPRIDFRSPVHETLLQFIHNESRGMARHSIKHSGRPHG